MDEPSLPEDFAALPESEQRRILQGGQQLVQLVFRHASAVCIGPPPPHPGKINNGTGCVLNLDGRHYFLTGKHVVDQWNARRSAGENVLFQVREALLDPSDQLAWQDAQRDISVLHLSERQVRQIGGSVCEPLSGWPPPQPAVGDYVLISGYPEVARQQPAQDTVDFHAFSTLQQVTTVGPDYLACQFQREHWVSFDMAKIPARGTWLGGMSGGPVLRVGRLAFPLVGLTWEFNENLEILYVRTLSHLPDRFD